MGSSNIRKTALVKKKKGQVSLVFICNYMNLIFDCYQRSLMIKMGKIIISSSMQFYR